MNRSRRETIVALTAVAVTPVVTAGAFTRVAAAQPGALSPQEARAIAKEVFLWGMHPVAIYHLRYIHVQNDKSPAYVGVGRLSWERKAKKANRLATTPNATTLYGVGFYDLSKEPVVITVGRYQGPLLEHPALRQLRPLVAPHRQPVQRTRAGAAAADRAKLERKISVRVRGSRGRASSVGHDVCRRARGTHGRHADELKVVNAIQDRMTVMSLSQWVAAGKKDVKAEDVPLTKGNYPTYPGMENVKEPGHLKGVDFLRWVSLILNDPSFTKQTDGHAEIAGVRQVRASWPQGRPDLRSGQAYARHQGGGRGTASRTAATP